MDQNVGLTDRYTRIAIGLVLGALGIAVFAGPLSNLGTLVGAITLVLGVVMLGTGLTQRCLLREPLPVTAGPEPSEAPLASALADIQPRLLEALRGSETEIRHRLDRYLEELAGAAPVLDLGCGRGELLLMLREAGVAAVGVEGDAALAGAARRRGLEVVEGEVPRGLEGLADGSRGAVVALHLFEHLAPADLLATLAEVRRILRPGGLLVAECPYPHTLRVGASHFWADPTHRRPLLPETLRLFLQASGLEPAEVELLHPFPVDQRLGAEPLRLTDHADPDLVRLAQRLDRVTASLDELVNGPRDFVLRASRPQPDPGGDVR